jgi:hypothetical protein
MIYSASSNEPIVIINAGMQPWTAKHQKILDEALKILNDL